MNIIKQYGLERSGTNYIKALLEINLEDVRVLSNLYGHKHKKFDITEDKVQKYNPKKDKNVKTDLSDQDLKVIKELFINKEINYIVSFKDPFSWVLSCHNYLGKGKPLSDKLIKKYITRWNVVNRDWIDKILNNKNLNSIGVIYDDLLLNPSNVIDKISKSFNLNLKKNFSNIKNKMKKGVDVKGEKNIGKRKFKKTDYYLKKEYMNKFNKNQIKLIKSLIDYKVLEDIEKFRINE